MKRTRKVSESEVEEQSADEVTSNDESDENIADEPEDDAASDDEAPSESAKDTAETQPPPKKKKRGIIYLSTIPKHMTVAIARDIFNQHAAVGRMFFQPETKTTGSGKHKSNPI